MNRRAGQRRHRDLRIGTPVVFCTDDSCDPTNGCISQPTTTPPEPSEISCADGADNDCDGLVDDADPDCGGGPERCGDGLDNDGDGIVDDGCIGDRAWDDFLPCEVRPCPSSLNFNGIQDPGEPGLAGATFRLFTSDGTLVASTVSDANGIYHFSNVPAGTYFLEADPPPGTFYSPTPANQGGDDTRDSDFFGPTNRTADFAFPADGSIDHLDASFAQFID